MICKNSSCKAELPDDAAFCLKCGTKQDIPKPNIQNDITETKPNNTDSKKKSIVITITVIILIACIAVGAVILAPGIIDAKSKTSTTETTASTHIEINEYSMEYCPIKITDTSISESLFTEQVELSIQWTYESKGDNLTADKVIFTVATYNTDGIEDYRSPRNFIYMHTISEGTSYKEVWKTEPFSTFKIIKIHIEYFENNLIEEYIDDSYEPQTGVSYEVTEAPTETKYNYTPIIETLEDCPIKVNSYYTTAPNSADGVSFYIDWYSTDEKEIKYIYFTVTPYNRVNDKQYCEIRDHSIFNGSVTGPFYYGSADYSYWDCAWYNSDIDHIELDKITIEYMDGTKRIYYN